MKLYRRNGELIGEGKTLQEIISNNKANLYNADLYNADLRNANLYNADLRNANLSDADLRNANLINADLYNADLRNANLSDADLRNANLYNANLINANLINANLYNADLRETIYTITQMFQAYWGYVSDKLCLWLMRLDCSACPDGKKRFERWIEKDICPFDNNIKRIVNFKEERHLWSYGDPPKMWTIWKQLAKEKGIKILN